MKYRTKRCRLKCDVTKGTDRLLLCEAAEKALIPCVGDQIKISYKLIIILFNELILKISVFQKATFCKILIHVIKFPRKR